MLFTNTALQDQVLHAQDTQSLTAWHGSLIILATLVVIVLLTKIVHTLMISQTNQKIWTATLIVTVAAGIAGTMVYHTVKSSQSEAYQDIRAQQHEVLHTVQTQLVEEYDILDAAPVLQHDEGEESTTIVANAFADAEHLDTWFQHLSKDDAFRPALVSVLTPETHDNHLYMVRFADDGETVILQNTPHAAEAPLVEEIVR